MSQKEYADITNLQKAIQAKRLNAYELTGFDCQCELDVRTLLGEAVFDLTTALTMLAAISVPCLELNMKRCK